MSPFGAAVVGVAVVAVGPVADGHLRAGIDGDPDFSPGQRLGSVDPLAHSQVALLELSNLAVFVGQRYSTNDRAI